MKEYHLGYTTLLECRNIYDKCPNLEEFKLSLSYLSQDLSEDWLIELMNPKDSKTKNKLKK